MLKHEPNLGTVSVFGAEPQPKGNDEPVHMFGGVLGGCPPNRCSKAKEPPPCRPHALKAGAEAVGFSFQVGDHPVEFLQLVALPLDEMLVCSGLLVFFDGF